MHPFASQQRLAPSPHLLSSSVIFMPSLTPLSCLQLQNVFLYPPPLLTHHSIPIIPPLAGGLYPISCHLVLRVTSV